MSQATANSNSKNLIRFLTVAGYGLITTGKPGNASKTNSNAKCFMGVQNANVKL